MKNNNYKCLLLENIDSQAELFFKSQGFKTELLTSSLSVAALIKRLKSVQVLCTRSRTQIHKKILLNSNLACIGAFCIGVNQIDLKLACQQGIPVFNAPYGNTRSVAEMVMGLIIGLARSLFEHSKNMHQGLWNKFSSGCHELRGKSLGIIGYGHIGSQVSVLAEAFGMKVRFYDIVNKLPIGNAQAVSSLKELVKVSDFVSLHVPETPLTKNLLSKKELSLMKSTSYVINTSRGSVLNLKDLKACLQAKRLAGAAIDVYKKEPKSNKEAFACSLQNIKQVILTPHVAGSTQEAQLSIVSEVSKSLTDFILTGTSVNAVNFPILKIPKLDKHVTRITNIHKNQPGVLSQINQKISDLHINIKNQYLATNSEIGYLVMDLEKKDVKKLCQSIFQLPSSIKTRIIS